MPFARPVRHAPGRSCSPRAAFVRGRVLPSPLPLPMLSESHCLSGLSTSRSWWRVGEEGTLSIPGHLSWQLHHLEKVPSAWSLAPEPFITRSSNLQSSDVHIASLPCPDTTLLPWWWYYILWQNYCKSQRANIFVQGVCSTMSWFPNHIGSQSGRLISYLYPRESVQQVERERENRKLESFSCYTSTWSSSHLVSWRTQHE